MMAQILWQNQNGSRNYLSRFGFTRLGFVLFVLHHPSGRALNTALMYNSNHPTTLPATATPTAIKHNSQLEGRDSGS